MARRLRDLFWFLSLAFRISPAITILWITIAAGTGIAIPVQVWAGSRMIDAISSSPSGSAYSPWLWLCLVVISLGTTLLLDAFLGYVDARFREQIAPDIQASIYEHATQVDLAGFEHQAFHDHSMRIMTETESSVLKLNYVTTAISCLPRFMGYSILLAQVDVRLLLVTMLPFVPNVWVWFRSGTVYWNTLSDQSRERRLASYYADRLADRQAAKEIRLFGLEGHFLAKWDENYWSTRDALRHKGLVLAIQQRGSNIASSLVLLAGLIWLVARLPERTSAGDVTVVVQAMISVPGIMFTLGDSLQRLGELSGYASDVRTFLSLPRPHAVGRSAATVSTIEQPTSGRGRIEAHELAFTYPNASQATIAGIDLTVAPGERIAIVGENGAGKTTLVKLLLGLYRPDAGVVTVNGENLAHLTPDQRRQRFSAVFQQYIHYPFSLADNITLGEDPDRETILLAHVMTLAGIETSTSRLISGATTGTILAPDLGGIDLSGGQWQRIAIARAAWRDAEVLALDEPTAALDPVAEVEIFRRFADMSQNRTTLLISHRLGMARLADRIVVVTDGRITESGTHDELRAQGGAYAGMWAAQARWYE